MNDSPLTLVADPHGNGFHNSAAVRFTVTRFNIYMKTVEAVGTVVPVIAAGAGRNHQTTAVAAVEGFFTGMGLIVALFVLSSFIFPIHGILSFSFFLIL